MNIFKIINHKIRKIYFYKSYSILQYFRIIFGINQIIKVNNWSLILPPKHLFSLYKKEYKHYDKFLVNLSKKLNKLDSLVDIGANVGDTLYQIINKKTNFNYFCIEGDEFFSSYLKKNIANLPISKQKKIKVIEEIVGKNLIGNLVGTGGTKSFKRDKSGRKSKTLNEIVNHHKIKNIKIIKVDVDGHDYNIIDSGLNIIKKFSPIIYFEIMIIDKFSIKNYTNTIYKLNQIGYKNWTILDNYGNKIFENENTSFFLKYIEKFKFGDLYDIACSNKKL